MPVSKIQLGQVWRNDADGKNYLVTKLYNEVFTQYAMLREASSNAADAVKQGEYATLPGYTYTQDAQDF
jgi:hypothetical protein